MHSAAESTESGAVVVMAVSSLDVPDHFNTHLTAGGGTEDKVTR